MTRPSSESTTCERGTRTGRPPGSLSLEPVNGYLHIQGRGLNIPVIGAPPDCRTPGHACGTGAFIRFGDLAFEVDEGSYEMGAAKIRDQVQAWVDAHSMLPLLDFLINLAKSEAARINSEPVDPDEDYDRSAARARVLGLARLLARLLEALVPSASFSAALSPTSLGSHDHAARVH